MVGILLFLLMVRINFDYIEVHLLFVALYNYVFCLLGLILFYVLDITKISSKIVISSSCFIILGILSSISFPPAYPIFITGSLSFYLVQQIHNKKISWILTLSGPVLLWIILLVI